MNHHRGEEGKSHLIDQFKTINMNMYTSYHQNARAIFVEGGLCGQTGLEKARNQRLELLAF
jgi:hypothetical protein